MIISVVYKCLFLMINKYILQKTSFTTESGRFSEINMSWFKSLSLLRPLFSKSVYFHLFNMSQLKSKLIKARMVCLRFKPRAAGWKAQTNPVSYSSTQWCTKAFYVIQPYLLFCAEFLIKYPGANYFFKWAKHGLFLSIFILFTIQWQI